ncbi:aldolase catalytic domain-containing protein [Magnetospirillum sp. UT-4]|uniref:aldolase catalytic domain-containing protein n=1 Tax=Magnetospirillum sp. UT-4 TaxID=2681467 RepID=UPI0013811218|nr:aldolase catalytic domain-containing protein [Magnetospirillum sp. UT-4]CAA7621729.1 Pyruvate carboxyltransferase [Magnetospirillum sp. UT-4]
MTLQPVTLLDCTLRDGGYYNDWDYDRDLVAAYLRALRLAGIDMVEIGFRSPPQARFLGPYAYSTDEFLARLPLPEGLGIAVMVNAKDLLSGGDPAAAVDTLFAPRAQSPVAMVRIAAHLSEVAECGRLVARLAALGYRIGFNLMQSSASRAAELEAAARAVANFAVTGFGAVEVLYFADSLGNMSPADIAEIVAILRRHWSGPLGVHTHDNMGNALANSLAALDGGVTWLDGTVLGMGRGAGNARMEYLLIELARRGLSRLSPEALFPLVMDQFAKLHRRYNWGPGLFYYLSAVHDVHPTYVQMMLADDRYRPDEIIAALLHLGQAEGSHFSGEKLKSALASGAAATTGSWSAAGFAQGRDVLLLAPGPGAERHAEALAAYVERQRPLVLCLNAKGVLPPASVDAYVTSNARRLAIESDLYHAMGRPLITPLGLLDDATAALLAGIPTHDYGLAIGSGFSAGATQCEIPHLLPAAYALAVANAGGARRILLAGFDGFAASDPRQHVMTEVLHAYEAAGLAPLLALTPTSYPVAQSSVYAVGDG